MPHIPTVEEVKAAFAEAERKRKEAADARKNWQDLAQRRIMLPPEMQPSMRGKQ